MVTHFFINEKANTSVCGNFDKDFSNHFVSGDSILSRYTTTDVKEVTCKMCLRTKAYKKVLLNYEEGCADNEASEMEIYLENEARIIAEQEEQ